MKRTVKKNIWMTEEEAEELKGKAEKACMNEAAYLRMLIAGYTPRNAPDDRFFHEMDKIDEMAEKADAILREADDPELKQVLLEEVKNWYVFRNRIEIEFLRPERIV